MKLPAWIQPGSQVYVDFCVRLSERIEQEQRRYRDVPIKWGSVLLDLDMNSIEAGIVAEMAAERGIEGVEYETAA